VTVFATPAPPTALRRTDEAVLRHGTHGRTWLDAMWDADPLADAVAADRAAVRQVRTLMTDGLGAVTDPAPAVAALLEQLTTPPDWLDLDRLDRASDVLVRYTAQWALVLGAASLLAGADNWIAAKPLLLTGRYGNQPAVRSIEVGEWLSHVVAPGGMVVDAPGFQHTVRVRMIHAHVRRHIQAHAEWDDDAWGVPIPQPYMAFTMAEFGHISLSAMARLGVRLRDDELDDIYHLWRYVGHVIGVDPMLNPVSEADHVRIEDLYHLTSPGPDEYSREFCRALTEDYLAPQLAGSLPGPARFREDPARRTMYGMSRVFLGDEAADSLGVPDGSAKHVVRALRPFLYGLDQTRLRALGRRRVTARGYAHRASEMARLKAENAMTHDLVDSVPGAVGSGG
jgi:mpaB/rubber oxygenase-like protein